MSDLDDYSKRRMTPEERAARAEELLREEEYRQREAARRKQRMERDVLRKAKELEYIRRTDPVDREQVRRRADRSVVVVMWVVILMLSMALVRIVVIQFSDRGEQWRALTKKKYMEVTPLPAQRGRILSADGAILIQSTPVYTVTVDFNTVRNSDFTEANIKTISRKMSSLFPVSAADYERQLRGWKREGDRSSAAGGSSTVRNIIPGRKRINSVTLAGIDTLPIFSNSQYAGGVMLATTITREGIYGEMGRRVLGRMPDSITGRNAFGIEEYFDKELRGVDGVNVLRRFSKNSWQPIPGESHPAQNGADVVTTLDARIQEYTHVALARTLEQFDAIRGTIVVMDVKTGEIKAMSNLHRENGRISEDYNYAIGSGFCIEPGSTLKLMTLMNLLDYTGTELTDKLAVNGRSRVFYGMTVTDTSPSEVITLQEAFEKSSNIGFALATLKYYEGNPDKYIKQMKERGIDKPFFLGINGEAAPYRDIAGKYENKKTDILVLSYGYGYKFTPLRTLMYYNAVANDGKMVAPRLVNRIERNGETIKEYRTEVINGSICKSSTLPQLKESMEGVVLYGTGRSVGNPYFRVAGKSGTARVYKSGGYTTSRGTYYLGSFCGYFPAEAPKYSCIVAIETFQPYGGPYKVVYGGALAGPAFKEVAQKIYRMGGDWAINALPPVKTRELADGAVVIVEDEKVNSDLILVRGDYSKTQGLLKSLSVKAADAHLSDGTAVSALDEVSCPEGEMPDVMGMGLRDALYELERRGLTVSVRGRGVVSSQSPRSGEKISKGAIADINLR